MAALATKTIITLCMLTSVKYLSGATIGGSGTRRAVRINIAPMPPNSIAISMATRYWTPITLWSRLRLRYLQTPV